MSTLAAAGDPKFVSLTTFRRSGAPVATTVWIAPDGDALVVTTGADTGKVRRLRRDPRVELRPCGRFGAVADDAPVAVGVGRVVAPDARSAAALRRKYGLAFRLAMAADRLRRHPPERLIIRITAA